MCTAEPPRKHFWGQTLLYTCSIFNRLLKTLLSGGCWKWVQPNSSGLEILFWNGKIEQCLIPFTHVVYSTGRSRNPPRDTFGGKHCFPGVAENEYSRTALASKFSLGMERLSKYSNSMFTHVVYSTGRSRNPPRDTFGGKHCFPGVAENEYSRTALASKFSLGMERLSKYCNSLYTCSILNRTIPQPPERHFWGQTLLSGGCWKWVQPNSSGLEILFWNGKQLSPQILSGGNSCLHM